jgi:hypothetical protein
MACRRKHTPAAAAGILSFLPVLAMSWTALGQVPPDWKTARTKHFLFVYHPKTADYLRPLVDSSESELQHLARFLGSGKVDPIEVRIARNTAEMKKIKPGDPPFEWATGMALRGRRMIVLSLTPPGGGELVGIRELFLHEVVHILTYDAAQRTDLPIWFNEGLAIMLSGEFSFQRTKTLLRAALGGDLLPIASLDRYYPEQGRKVTIAYAQSADLVKFISDSYGGKVEIIPELFKRLRRGDEFEPALESLCKRSIKQIEKEWMRSLSLQYMIAPTLMGGGALWGMITALVILAYIRRLRKARENLRKMEIEEEFFNPVRKDFVIEVRETGKMPTKSEDLKKVYHDGRFHTLH